MKFLKTALAEEIACDDGSVVDSSIGCINQPGGIISADMDLSELVNRGAGLFLIFAGSIATIMLIYSGVQYAMAMGDDEKIDTAKRNIKWSLVGLGISISAYAIVEFVIKNII